MDFASPLVDHVEDASGWAQAAVSKLQVGTASPEHHASGATGSAMEATEA